MSTYHETLASLNAPVPQSAPVDPRQKVNHAGGFSFTLDDWGRMERFLILGSEGGTYYVREQKLTAENALSVMSCLAADRDRAIRMIVSISDSGRAPKNTPAIFALALAAQHADVDVRRAAMAAMPAVCRTGTHLFQFVSMLKSWGPVARRGIAAWYNGRSADQLAYQLVKYRMREKWTHRDVLRKAHVEPVSDAHNVVLRWAAGVPMHERVVKGKGARAERSYGALTDHEAPRVIDGFLRAQDRTMTAAHIVRLISDYGLTHEMLPSEHLASPDVWEALLQHMPMGAMLRNLGRMTANGLLVNGSAAATLVAGRLVDAERLQKARVHPMAVITALKTYNAGKGMKGSLAWQPVQGISTALDRAFYAAFKTVKPSGKRQLLALDVSGSMGCAAIAGSPLTAREATAVMAMVTVRTEPEARVMAFSSRFVPVDIRPDDTLGVVIGKITNLPFEGTDCALPMVWAEKTKLAVDAFAVYTDNETWAGDVHPHKALQSYRKSTVAGAKLAVVGTSVTEFTIADPTDAGMLDIVGFDSAAPAVMADFFRGSPAAETAVEEETDSDEE